MITHSASKELRFLVLIFCFGLQQAASGQDFAVKPDPIVINGLVVDAGGKPIENATVHTLWRANGSPVMRSNGKPYDDVLTDEQVREFWSNVGKMEALTKEPTLTQKDGTFSLEANWRHRTVFAMDADRNQGGIVELPIEGEDDASTDIVLTLTELVTVKGNLKSAFDANPAEWIHVYAESIPNPEKPLATNRLISCGSFEGQFEFRLPPGEYQLDAYGSSSINGQTNDLIVIPAPTFKVPAGSKLIDLGTFELTRAPTSHTELANDSQTEGRWRDFKEHYGEPAPQWHAIDGRHIEHHKNIEGLRGKWVLLDFWGLSCAPCLKREIPKLMDFYEKNAKHRARFEIVGICIDYTGEIDSLETLESQLLPIETRVWQGKKIPFPIVLDNTFKTWERYGLAGLGTMVLVDPKGNLMEGDEKTLQEILDQDED